MARNDATDASSTAKRGRGAGRPFAPGNRSATHRGGSRPAALLRLDAAAEADAGAILRRMLNRAKQGDHEASVFVLSRLWPQRRGRPVTGLPALPADAVSALSAILAATVAGIVSPEEAEAVARIVRTRAEAGEWAELGRRLAALEGRQGGSDP